MWPCARATEIEHNLVVPVVMHVASHCLPPLRRVIYEDPGTITSFGYIAGVML